jgi:hypothetical protein
VIADGRTTVARRRVRAARIGIAGAAGALFAAGIVLARGHQPSHRKEPVTPLAAPPDLLRVVRRNQLAAGILKPAEAPPGIGSAPS